MAPEVMITLHVIALLTAIITLVSTVVKAWADRPKPEPKRKRRSSHRRRRR